MVVGVHDAQYPQAVSPVRLMASLNLSSNSGTRWTLRPSPRAATDILGAQHEAV
jgi:hypothetical protein